MVRRRLLRVVAVVVGLVLLMLAATAGTGVIVLQRSIPTYEGRAVIPGLATPVEVRRDAAGIPQIYADTAEDLFRAQGYVHAQDRFFQMDFRRHVTSGRLAEWFGEDFVETDAFLRTLGWREVARRELAELDPASRGYLEAYAAGVNAYLQERRGSRLSFEYTWGLFGPASNPAPWTPVDSLAWFKAMAWDLGTNMADEIDRVLMAAEVDAERVQELFPPYPHGEDGHTPIVPRGAVVGGEFDADAGERGRAALPAETIAQLERVGEIAERIPPLVGKGDGVGSNAWVVDGSRTASGQPLLANDPHLGAEMPSTWYQVGLHCRERAQECPFDVAGFGFAGVPGVVIGHNEQIAWGLTNLTADVMDLYVERVDGQSYLFDGDRYPLATRREDIRVKGRDEPVELTVRSTRHGPILSDVDDELATVAEQAPAGQESRGGWDHVVSLRWTALDPGRTAEALFELNRARDWESFREAASKLDSPTQNLLYADVEGNIGYQMPGRIPVRRSGDGRWPAPGWSADYGWVAWIPFEELPSVLNPEEGYLVASNQAVVGPDYPYHVADRWTYGYRSERQRQRIEDAGELDVAAMQRLQVDDTNTLAEVLLPALLEVDLNDEFVEEARRLLRGWNGSQNVDSAAAAYFNAVWQNLLRATFGDELPRKLWPSGSDRWYEVVRRLLDEPDNAWWDDVDTPRREGANAMLREALVRARDALTRTQSKDPTEWRWGDEHLLELRNPALGSSGIAPLEWLYNREPIEVAGGTDATLATQWSAATDGYAAGVVPSMRMVVDLADFDESRWIDLSGVSGHPRHEHYGDQFDRWVRGETLPWAFSRAAVRRATEHVLTLEPARG